LSAGGLMGRIPAIPVLEELPVLCEWLWARPELAALVQKVQVVRPMTTKLADGTWIRASLCQSDHPRASSFNHVGYHGTSMNNLGRCIVQGMHMGWSGIREGESDAIVGVYMMGPDAIDLCSTYMLYSPLQRSGYYYAPIVEIRYVYDHTTESRKHVAKKAGRATQYVTYPDVSTISAVYFHVVAAADLVTGSKDIWINVEAERPRDMEIPLQEAWDAIVRRSYDRWVHTKALGLANELRDD